ncbi:hypothetical protein V8687_03940 [Shewanella baltica]|uniref:hypothetical protein n=1 Tax=Shewanella baltica TaxID=62322 RepID=UPI0030D5C318
MNKNMLILASLLLSHSVLANDLDAHSQRLFDLARQTEIANAEADAAAAKLKVVDLNKKLNPPLVITPEPAIEKLSRTHSPSVLDTIRLKSLVTTNGITSGWIAVDSELVEIKRGARFGSIAIIELTSESVLLSDGQRQKRLYVSGEQPRSKAEKDEIYAH